VAPTAKGREVLELVGELVPDRERRLCPALRDDPKRLQLDATTPEHSTTTYQRPKIGNRMHPPRSTDESGGSASEIFGVSGGQMLAALIAGERDPKALAEMARTRMRAKIPQVVEAFTVTSTSITGPSWRGCWPALTGSSQTSQCWTRRSRGSWPLSP
jgi:hypothetical protein